MNRPVLTVLCSVLALGAALVADGPRLRESRPLLVKAKKGQMLVVSGSSGRTLGKLNGSQKSDEFGVGLGFDSLPMTAGVQALAVGAPGADGGAGRIFAVDPSNGRRLWFVSGENLAGGAVERFGQAMTNLGHINGDSPVHWAVGAPGSGEASQTDAAVVVLHAQNNELVERLRVEGDAGSRLGWDVILSDDVTNDSFIDHFVAGAPSQANGSKANAGALHRFSSIDGTRDWTLLGKKKNQYLGYRLAFAPDEDGDGVRDLTVGAPGNEKTSGLVLIVSGANGRVIHQIKAPRGAGLFGLSVARTDIDGDGALDIVAGAPMTNGAAGAAVGKVFAFSGADRSLMWSREGESAGQWFGASVSSALDSDGDGLRDLLVGSLFRVQPKPKKELKGGVDLISPANDSVLLQIRGKRGGDLVGVPLHGPLFDVNGDGITDFMVGSPRGGELFLPE